MSQESSPSPAAAPRKTLEVVSYQPGSIVSSVVLKQKGGSVTHFAFDVGQELSEHTAPYDALVSVLDGEVEITLAGEPIRVAAGEMMTLPANRPHALRAITRFKMILTMIRGTPA